MHLGRDPGYVRDPPKAWTMPPTNQFHNLGLRLTWVIGVVWDASVTDGSWCSLA